MKMHARPVQEPNFIIIGAMKCATTSLFDALSAHPQIATSKVKETDFFAEDEIYARGLPWYQNQFAPKAGARAIGEASPNYTKHLVYPHVSERIARCLPDAKLIYIARNPLQRMESHWLHRRMTGEDTASFADSLAQQPAILDTSLYWKQINLYRRHYADDRILVLFFEDFAASTDQVLEQCCRFLDVAPIALPKLHRFATTDARMDRPLLKLARSIPNVQGLIDLRPDVLRPMVRRIKRSFMPRSELPAALRSEVIGRLAEDAKTFLEFYGKPADFWRLH